MPSPLIFWRARQGAVEHSEIGHRKVVEEAVVRKARKKAQTNQGIGGDVLVEAIV